MGRSHKLLFFEGLRGIAAFMVVLWHLRLTFYSTAAYDLRTHLKPLPFLIGRLVRAVADGLCNGGFAVWLFWIMSAFVLSLQFFLRAHQTPHTGAHDYLEDAFLRRYPRLLLPVLASVIFAYVIHALGGMHNAALAQALAEPEVTGWLSSFYTFPASLPGALKSAFWQSFFAYDQATTYNAVLWTMQAEFYGSVFLFAFLGLLGHRRSRFFAYPVIVLVNFAFQLHWLNAFVAGIALCDLFVNRDKLSPVQSALGWPVWRKVRESGLLAAALWSVVIAGVGLGNYWQICYLILGTAAVALTLVSRPTQRLLSSGVPVFLGKISFALYLIHLPFICSFSCWAYLKIYPSVGAGTAAILVSLTTCVLTILLGYVLYLVADRPSLALSRRFSALIMRRPDQARPDAP